MSNRLSGDCSIPKIFVPYLTPADITERLFQINPSLALAAKEIMLDHKQTRHIRGGMATKLKYEREKALKT